MGVWGWGLALGVVAVVAAWIARGAARAIGAFVGALRERAADLPGSGVRSGGSRVDAERALLAAEDGIRSARRLLWREWIGIADPALRHRTVIGAWAEVVSAERAMRSLAARAPALDPGPESAVPEDPLQALARRGAWGRWWLLQLAPWIVRTTYTLFAVRAALGRVSARVQALERQLAGYGVDGGATGAARSTSVSLSVATLT